MIAAPPSPSDRLLSASYYVGLAPLTRIWRSDSSNLFLQHHHAQARAALFLFLMFFLAACVFEGAECFILIQFPWLEEFLVARFGSFLPYLDNAEVFVIAALLAFWVTLLGLALAGSEWQVPFLNRLSRRPWLGRISSFANSLVLVLIPIVVILALRATTLTRRSAEDAKVYFLYDEGIEVPRWGYALGLYRISLQARRNWGKGSTVLDRLNKNTLRTALASGRVVILATHGDAGYVATYFAPEVLGVWPPDSGVTDETKSAHFLRMAVRGTDNKWGMSENVKVSNQLQLAYIFGCNAGNKASQWREHLAPAQVVTYNRLSTVFDHALWFAFTGPSQLETLR
jgi:hypothetical protein